MVIYSESGIVFSSSNSLPSIESGMPGRTPGGISLSFNRSTCCIDKDIDE